MHFYTFIWSGLHIKCLQPAFSQNCFYLILIMNVALEKCICVKDFEKLAAKLLTRNASFHFNSGATDKQTLEDSCTAFKKWRFQPRVLQDVSEIDITTTVLGDKILFPICIAPTSMNKMASAGGELDSAKAAASLGTGFTLGTWASTSIEDVNTFVPSVLRWFQLYMFKDRELTQSLVKRAEENGFRAIIVTIDTPLFGHMYQVIPIKFSLPNLDAYQDCFFKEVRDCGGRDFSDYVASLIDPSLSWNDIEWLKSITNLPIVVKGILTAEMALEAVSHGVNGIVVSNHGGRQLDGVLPSINALPQVTQAVLGRCEIYLDGGIRNGGDVTKAISLGAKAVFVGRPIIWGLACGGEAGARKVLEILRDEFKHTMKLLGTRSIAELQTLPNLVVHESKILSKL